MTDFHQAMHDPEGTFPNPQEVIQDKSLSREQKIKILEQWEWDARELHVAEEENMPNHHGQPTQLSRIHEALRQLRDNP